MSGTTSIKVGDSVIVKRGILCPDMPSLSLAGWQGRVTEINSDDTIEFKLDSKTLRSMPEKYINASEIEGLDWQSMILGIEEVELTMPRDTLLKAEAIYSELQSRHSWDTLSVDNPGINEVVGDLANLDGLEYLEIWEEHFERVFQFPFEAIVAEMEGRGPVHVGDIVKVLKIAEVDEDYGILVDVEVERRKHSLPLCDLEATNKSSLNYQPLRDYVVWFANR